MRVLIKVEQRHIDAGQRDPSKCPIALAILEVLGKNCGEVAVGRHELTVYGLSGPIPIPLALVHWIVTYDSEHKVPPLSFILTDTAIEELTIGEPELEPVLLTCPDLVLQVLEPCL